MAPRLRLNSLLMICVAVFTLAALVWVVGERRGAWRYDASDPHAAVMDAGATPARFAGASMTASNTPPASASVPEVAATPEANPSAAPTATPAPVAPSPVPPASPVSASSAAETGSELLIPVAGVSFAQLRDTYDDARSENRVHDAIDIMAPGGTPVVACADGRVAKLFHSDRGGTTLYQLSADEHTVYYYAHLASYADGVAEGKTLRRGELLGYVGDTGNAGPGNFHLHFAVSRISDPHDLHGGVAVNPYDLFRPR